MKRKNLLLLLLALSMTGNLMACGNTTETENAGDTVQQETEPTETTPETQNDRDELPADLDFGGITVGIASNVNVHYHGYLDVATNDENTTVLDEAIYNRNRDIEERLNLKITEFTGPAANVESTFTNTITAGDDTYSIAHMADRTAFALGLEGYLQDMTGMPYLDFDKAYWYEDGNAVLRVGGKQLAAFGEMSLGTYDYTHLLAFNQNLIAEYGLTSPYEYLENDTWTFDNFRGLITAVYDDLDGNGTMDENDRYGFHTRAGFLFPLMYNSAGLKTVVNNEDGVPTFNMAGNEAFVDVFDWCNQVFIDEGAWFKQNNGNDFLTKSPMFQENKVLITDMTFFYVGSVRDMVSDFGIMVYPKYDEGQDRYYSWVEGGAKSVGISAITANVEAVCALLEAMGSASIHDVIPVYYEINLKNKYTRDEISAQVFDIIRETRTFDLGDTVWCNDVREVLGNVFKDGKPLASSVASINTAVTAKIESTLEALAD